ncbi:MAG: sugar ABC transporter permease, partial [Rectinemataceae bacterium]
MNSKRPGKTQDVAGSLPPLVPALASLIVPGLGQLLNRQKLKALLWFMVPVLLLAIEFSSSQWGRYLALVSGRVPEDAIASTRQVSSELNFAQASDENVMATLFGAPAAGDHQEEAGNVDPFAEAAEVANDTSQGSGDPFADAGDSSGSMGESYFTQTYRWPDYRTEGPHYPMRDFGGFFTRGLWGLFTLGRLRIGDSYGGTDIELFNKISPWMTADNSIVLLGNGLIALMVLIIFLGLWALGVADAYGSRKRINATGRVERFGHFIRRVWDSLFVYIISAPSFALILMFTVIPILFTFLLAFTDYTYKTKLGAMLINWVGFGTFRYLTLDPGWLAIFGNIFLWTVVWAFISSFTVYALGFFNAMVV